MPWQGVSWGRAIGKMIVPRGTSGEVVCFTKYEPSFAAPGIVGNRPVRGLDRRVVGSHE